MVEIRINLEDSEAFDEDLEGTIWMTGLDDLYKVYIFTKR